MIRFYLLYWSVATFLIGGMYLSVTRSFAEALFLATATLPIIVITKYLWHGISFANRRKGIMATCCLVIFVLLIQYLVLILVQHYLFGLNPNEFSGLLFNPFFLVFLFVSLLAFEEWIERMLYPLGKEIRESWIEFTSDRKKIRLEIDHIRLVESRDSEVWIVTSDNSRYRTKMNITQWESVLDDRFLRIHRSFMLNKAFVTRCETHAVYIGDESFEVSRKYRERVSQMATIKDMPK